LENCLYSPPKLKETTPLSEIARNMMESKVYYLPVFAQNENWMGIVSIRTLLREAARDKQFVKELNIPRKTKIITVKDDANLGEARTLLSNKGVSRLPVVNASGRLVGILTRFDLRQALSEPKSSQRFLSRDGEKRKFINKPIRNYYKKVVVTVKEKIPLAQMLNLMLDEEIGSVIIVNTKWQPIDILSYRDILKAIALSEKSTEASFKIHFPNDFLEKKQFTYLLRKLLNKLQKKNKIFRVEANVKSTRNPVSKTKQYKVILIVRFTKIDNLRGVGSDYVWKKALRKAISRVERQVK
jgi:CBS domain-containing protein